MCALRFAFAIDLKDTSSVPGDFSNKGPCVDIWAPGSEITSLAAGRETGTVSISGTSMAAPHVTGVVARYRSIGGFVQQ